jgi:phosphoglucosamine mutase
LAGIFRAYDIRGIYGESLTISVMEDLGKAVGSMHKRVLIGADLRHSSPELKKAFVRGFKTTGSELFVGPDGSAGMVWYNAHLKNAVRAYITGSHLEVEWNGLKLHYPNGVSTTPEEMKAMEDIYEKKDFREGESRVENVDLSEKYYELLTESFKAKCNPIIDFGGGAATKGIPDVWRKIAKKAHFLFEKTDPFLKVRSPEPNEKTLIKLKEKVVGKDIGIGYDGDADRAAFFDDKAKRVLPEVMVVLMAEEMDKPRIVMTVECSNVIRDCLPDAKIYTVPVGHGFVTPACMEHKANFGVESSGHFVVGKYSYYDDAVLASMAVTDKLDGKLSRFTKKLPEYSYEQINFKVTEDRKAPLMEKIREEMEKDYEIDAMDGIKVIFDDGWALIRPSQTEAKVRLTIETKTRSRLENLKKQFSGMIR